jgi:molybdopterin synthase sulfur carrier subunit
MPTVHFTNQLERFVSAPVMQAEGETLRDAVFWEHPKLRGYILDDQGAVRRHVAIFIDGAQVSDRDKLSDPVSEDGEIYVFQALTGG